MKILCVHFYQRVNMGGPDHAISLAYSYDTNSSMKVFELELIEGLGVKVTGEFNSVIVPFNNVAQIVIPKSVKEEEKPKSKKGA